MRKLFFPAWFLPNGTIKATENTLEEASSSCERWGIWCAALVVVSVLVEFAIALAHPEYDSAWERWGSAFANLFIALGIVGEVGWGTIWNNRIQTELRKRSNDKLAEAMDRASEAQSELVKFRAPRTFTNEQISTIAGKMRAFAGTGYCFCLSFNDREIANLAILIGEALRQADWMPVHGLQGYRDIILATGHLAVVGVSVTGIEVAVPVDDNVGNTFPVQLLGIASALNKALVAEGLSASSGAVTGMATRSPNAIHVMIGRKE